MTLDGEMRTLNDGLAHSEEINLEHKLHADIEKAFDEEAAMRHTLEVELVTELRTKKETERTELEKGLQTIEKDLLGMKDYQDALKETSDLKEKIEEMKVKIQFLDIEVKMLTEVTEQLNNLREELTEEKKLADGKNEELKTQLKAQTEIANKRLQNKLNREKSAEIKDLLANEEMIKATNEDINNKLRTERENYDQLLRDKIELKEKLHRKTTQLENDTKIVEEQDKLLAELKKEIEAEQADVDKLLENVEEGRKVKRSQEEANRQLQQDYTHLSAKQEFIETNYEDVMVAPGDMNLNVFSDISSSNDDINKIIDSFVNKVKVVKTEARKFKSKFETY